MNPENDRKVHIRGPRNVGEGPRRVLCGRLSRDVASVSSAFGYWSPAGDGWDGVCTECQSAVVSEARTKRGKR